LAKQISRTQCEINIVNNFTLFCFYQWGDSSYKVLLYKFYFYFVNRYLQETATQTQLLSTPCRAPCTPGVSASTQPIGTPIFPCASMSWAAKELFQGLRCCLLVEETWLWTIYCATNIFLIYQLQKQNANCFYSPLRFIVLFFIY